jgi:hypothetical protein
MSVAVSATGTATYNGSATTQNYTFTVNSGDSLALFLIAQDATESITSVNWDSAGTNQPCTVVASKSTPTATHGAIYLYAVVNPTSGTKNLKVINGTATGTSAEMQSYTGTVTTSVAAACTNVLTANGGAVSGTFGTAAQSGASGDMYVSGYVTADSITSVQQTSIYLLAPAGNDAAGNRQASTGTSVSLTATGSIGATSGWAAVSCDIVAATGGANVSLFGWRRTLDDGYPKPIAFQADAGPSTFLRPSQNVVPQTWLPKAGGTDVERLPPVGRSPDEALPFFVQSPNPVPTFYPPATGADRERLPPIARAADEGIAFGKPAPTVPISGMAWYAPAADRERLPPIQRSPDEATPFFAQSPSPVPARWLPQWDGWERPKRIDADPSALAFSFKAPVTASTISGMAWFNPPDTRLPPIFGDPYAVQTLPPFIEPPLLPFMAQTNADDFNPQKPITPGDGMAATWAPRVLVQTVGISGMAWYVPGERYELPRQLEDRPTVYVAQKQSFVGISGMPWWIQSEPINRSYPGVTDQRWAATWVPQFIAANVTVTVDWLVRARRRGQRQGGK